MPTSSEHDLRFAQDRVALFAKTTVVISAVFLVATAFADLQTETPRYLPLGRVGQALGTVLALAVWLPTRTNRTLSPLTLQSLDVAGTIGICWSLVFLGHHAMQPYGSYTGLLAVTYVSVARAIMVPSVPRRTCLIAVTSFAALTLSRLLLPEAALHGLPRARSVLEALLWSGAGTAVVTLASSVIYGLEEKARTARQLGQYTLGEKIGQGGMGEVYEARHAMLRRPTAVKLLAGDGSERQLRRFEKEVQLTARLTHPNTISIYDYGRTPDGVFYYAMELLDGWTLEQLVERYGPQPPGRVIHILRQVCGALAEAHGIGLIHRDIKPANIHLCRRGDVPDVVKVLDFGLVRELKDEVNVSESAMNTVVGTPLYLSPEAILTPERMDGRADLYSLGCVGYFLLTGEPPFQGLNVIELGAQHLHSAPPPPSARSSVPEDLERVVLACLAKDPAARPESAQKLSAELERCGAAASWSTRDAEKWWEIALTTQPQPVAKLPPSGVKPRRQVRVDLERRFERLEEVLAEMSDGTADTVRVESPRAAADGRGSQVPQ